MLMLKTIDGPTYRFQWKELKGQRTGCQKKSISRTLRHATMATLSMMNGLRHSKLKMKTRMLLTYPRSIQKFNQACYIRRYLKMKKLRPQMNIMKGALQNLLMLWKQQFADALKMESTESRKLNRILLHITGIFWQFLLFPWRLLFAFVPPYHVAHGWISFICSLLFISGIAYIVTELTDLIICVTGINSYVIAFTALASGTSWPDLVASKIAAECQTTADSAIANITHSN